MTDNDDSNPFLVLPFPSPGPLLRKLYRHWWVIANGTDHEREKALRQSNVGKPWDPATLGTPSERLELWRWLEQFVGWFNHEYGWDTGQTIPACWPEHPHLVHEIAVLADARRRAGTSADSGPLEEWHRVCVPWFLQRMRESMKSYCEERHQTWPARARYHRHVSQEGFDRRYARVLDDVDAVGLNAGNPWIEAPEGDRINLITGEVVNDAEADGLAQDLQQAIQNPLPTMPQSEDDDDLQ
jgi:hypothetical protein